MATAVETLGKLERRLTITFPVADVRTEVEKRLKKQAKTAKAPGFRPGKVPLKMVAAQYGYQIESDVLNDKVGRAFNDAANENQLRVAGFPKIEPKQDAPEGMLAFDATFEVYPDVVIGDLANVEIETVAADLSDAEIDAYVATKEPLKVAGAFTIDSLGGAFIRALEGDPHCVIGLSLPTLRDLVLQLGVDYTSLWNR